MEYSVGTIIRNTCVSSMRWKEREGGHNPAKKKLEEAR